MAVPFPYSDFKSAGDMQLIMEMIEYTMSPRPEEKFGL